MTDQTRADFEAHFGLTTRQAWQHKDGSYKFPEIQAKWEGYQAGVAKAAPPEPVNGKEPAAYFWRDKVEGTVGLRFTMPEWVDSPDKQRYELVRLYAAPVAAAAPGDDDAKDAAPSDELTVKCAYCGKQITKGGECLNARFAMECRQSR